MSGTRVWKVGGDWMTGTILLLMVGRGIPLLIKTSVMVSWAVLGSLENRLYVILCSAISIALNSGGTAHSPLMPASSLV